jgi:4-azaleucine resistance transporter AzlC
MERFTQGIRDIAPIVIATIPFGLIFGALAAKEDMSLTDGVLLSALTYAGASQFVALEFWSDPLPFWTILFSVAAVNLRLLLYSAALGGRIAHWPALTRYAGLGLLTDPIFALAELQPGRLSAAYYFGIAVPLYLNWIATTAIGFIFGSLIAHPEMIGLDFVVAAYFIHLVMSFRTRPHAGAVIAASAMASLAAYLTVGSPWHFAGGALVGMAVAALLAGPKRAAHER